MVPPTCSINASNLSFGTYNPLSITPLTATSSVTATCTNGTAYSLALNSGNTGNFLNRVLLNGLNILSYNLYTSSAYTTIWGDGTSGTSTQSGTGNGIAQPYTVYGRILAAQNAIPSIAAYNDNIVVTITY